MLRPESNSNVYMTNMFNYVSILWCCVCAHLSAAAVVGISVELVHVNGMENDDEMLPNNMTIACREMYDASRSSDVCQLWQYLSCAWRSQKVYFCERKKSTCLLFLCVCDTHYHFLCIYFIRLWYYEYESQYGIYHSYYAFISHFSVVARAFAKKTFKKKCSHVPRSESECVFGISCLNYICGKRSFGKQAAVGDRCQMIRLDLFFFIIIISCMSLKNLHRHISFKSLTVFNSKQITSSKFICVQ